MEPAGLQGVPLWKQLLLWINNEEVYRPASEPLSLGGRSVGSDFKVSMFYSNTALIYVNFDYIIARHIVFSQWSFRCTVLYTLHFPRSTCAIVQKGRCGQWPALHSAVREPEALQGGAPCLMSQSIISPAGTRSWQSRSSQTWLWFALGTRGRLEWMPAGGPDWRSSFLLPVSAGDP